MTEIINESLTSNQVEDLYSLLYLANKLSSKSSEYFNTELSPLKDFYNDIGATACSIKHLIEHRLQQDIAAYKKV